MLFPMSLKIATGKNLEFECSIYIVIRDSKSVCIATLIRTWLCIFGEFGYFKCHYYVKNLRGADLGFEVSGVPIAYGTPNSQK